MNRKYCVAVVGATGLVGSELVSILAERKFPVSELRLLASKNSVGETVDFHGESLKVRELTLEAMQGVQIAFLAVDGPIARKVHGWAQETGTILIDKSSAFRMDPEVPLVVPEVNPEDVAGYKRKNIIACPNCTSTPLVQILKPLHERFGLKRVTVVSYQAVSGAGKQGIEELERQTRDLFALREIEPSFFPNRIAFNILPYIADEEEKMMAETKRILRLPELKISATCARVPVFNGHSAAVHLEFENAVSHLLARDILARSPGIEIVDDVSEKQYPTPVDASGGDMTLVGRIRADESVTHGLALWYSSDNLRTGAALNAVKVAEILVKEYLK